MKKLVFAVYSLNWGEVGESCMDEMNFQENIHPCGTNKAESKV
jgi:hypothetical protein